MPTSSGQGERDLIDSTISYKFLPVSIHEGSTSLFITRESWSFRKPQSNLIPFSKRSLNPNRRSRFACRSTGLVDRPFPSVARSIDRRQQKHDACQSVDRSGRPCLASVERVAPVHAVHAGRPGDRPASVLAHC